MRIKIKKLHPDAVIPKYATRGSAGFDLAAIEDVCVEPGETKLVKTGLSFEIPEGYELQIRPRSGLSLKTSLRVPNSPGTVDSDFRAEVCVIVYHTGLPLIDAKGRYLPKDAPISIKKGDRIAQGVICPIVQADFIEVTDLNETERGTGGFGSTGVGS